MFLSHYLVAITALPTCRHLCDYRMYLIQLGGGAETLVVLAVFGPIETHPLERSDKAVEETDFDVFSRTLICRIQLSWEKGAESGVRVKTLTKGRQMHA